MFQKWRYKDCSHASRLPVRKRSHPVRKGDGRKLRLRSGGVRKRRLDRRKIGIFDTLDASRLALFLDGLHASERSLCVRDIAELAVELEEQVLNGAIFVAGGAKLQLVDCLTGSSRLGVGFSNEGMNAMHHLLFGFQTLLQAGFLLRVFALVEQR